MEHFGARDERPVAECVRLVRDESDVFVGVYAHRYGHVPEGSSVSISEVEYRTATDAKLHRFIYLIDKDHPWLPGHIDDGVNRDRLLAFKAELMNQHVCEFFGTANQLATKVAADVGRYIAMQTAPKVGPGMPIQNIGIDSLRGPVIETADEWNERRAAVYAAHRGVFLAHVVRPSSRSEQPFDVFIYLIRHKRHLGPGIAAGSGDLSDVRFAEFFLGPYWENKVFPAVERQGFIGIATSAHGTFLCICRVTFTDGTHVYLERYIDFEAQRTGGTGA